MAALSPADAEVALRTFPRRWNALLGGLDPDDPDTEAVLRHPGPDNRTAAECAAEAAAALVAADGHVRKAVTNDRPTLEPGSTPANSSLRDALGGIEAAAPALAATVAGVAAGDLDREADLGGRTVTVRALVADAVEHVANLLRAAEQALRAGRAAPH